MSDSLRPYGLWPTRLLCPRNSPGKNTGVGCHFLLQKGSVQFSRSVVSDSAIPWTITYQAPPSMGFSRQERWSGLPFPSPGDLPDPGIEPGSPALQADALPSEPQDLPKKDTSPHITPIWSSPCLFSQQTFASYNRMFLAKH